MSALDKAFLKAFGKEIDLSEPGSDHRATDASVGQPAGWNESEPTPYMVGVYQTGIAHRVDDGHLQVGWATPHVQLTQVAGYTDTSFVGPYQEPHDSAVPAKAARSSSPLVPKPALPETPAARVVPPPPLPPNQKTPPAPAVAPAEQHRTAAPVTPPVVPAPQTPVKELQETLRSASAIRLPATLELPTVFRPAASEDAPDPKSPELTPEWEVDRFAWPSICQRLLETRSRYFQHVGRRLKDAVEENHHILLVTGSRRGEGRTTLTLCLARCAAEAGVKVALVDADLTHPELGTQLGMEAPCSWLEVISGKSAVSEAAVTSIEDRLALSPLIRTPDADRAAREGRFAAFLRQLSAHFPLVIVDSGPAADDSLDLFTDADNCLVDTAIIVRDLRHTTEKKALSAAQQLQQRGIPAVGIAENFGHES